LNRPATEGARTISAQFIKALLQSCNTSLPTPLKEDRTARAQTILEAHEALIKTAPENLPKFKDVIHYLEEELHLSK
jgi:hypothetical protein